MVIDWSQAGGDNAQIQPPKVRAAQYVGMSTEHQKYWTDNQADAIQGHADRRGDEIVQTYADDAVALVYDVSRWGRFQDPDEAAIYELRCRRAGVAVHYCAEQFANDGNLGSSLIKTFNCAMVGEYGRELSAKMFAGPANLIRLG